MKQLILTILALASITISANAQTNNDMQEVHDFLKKCGTYFIATVEGDQPRVRPFGTVNIFDGKLYIQTGKKKDVAKQIAQNPKIEICAFDGAGQWIRIQAVA
ncbi:MAG: pyridoxamine 5'-phosphate oxidase family protein, partial [Candidatus Symbiothrix sp.]|nr:pyridoxamine 5'-phosphate oxidase family protein [Candidatus Symbiothrix sp.]